MKITRIESQVEHIKSQHETQAYAGAESLTCVCCRVTTDDGLTGEGVTGRFLADQVAHLLNGGMAGPSFLSLGSNR